MAAQRIASLSLCLWVPCAGTAACGPQEGSGASQARDPGPVRAPAADHLERAAALVKKANELGEGDLEQARLLLEEAVLLAPGNEAAVRSLAELLLRNVESSEPSRALELLTDCFGAEPRESRACLLMARAAYRDHRYELSSALARRILEELDSTGPAGRNEARYLLGSVHERHGRYEEALAVYRAGLLEAPDLPLFLTRQGVVLAETGKTPEAIRSLERAVTLQPDNKEAHFHLARLHRQQGESELAGRAQEIHFWLNRYTDSRAETEKAFLERIEALARLEAIYPEYTAGRLKLAELQIRRGDHDAAIAVSLRLLEEGRPDERAFALLMEALRRLGDDGRARREMRSLLEAVPDLPLELRQQALRVMLEGLAG